ncbi:MAG: hypothetical protein QW279_15755 [Candidatus Jordarchaeaceae archaeon]
MPDMGNGLMTAITGTILGFVASAVVSAVLGAGNGLAVLFNFLSIIVGIGSLQSAKYWGLLYSAGYFAGIALIGKYFMEPWEYPLYLFIVGFYIFLKLTRKI